MISLRDDILGRTKFNSFEKGIRHFIEVHRYCTSGPKCEKAPQTGA